MSHIPASRMPHAHAHGDLAEPQADQDQPAPEPTTSVPPASASGVLSAAEHSSVDGPTSEATKNDAASSPGDIRSREVDKIATTGGLSARDEDERSPYALAAMVIGGLAIVGGIVAALVPLLAPAQEPKSKKRKRRKAA